jgi:cation diffusion facilitator CzcD-associated flavoprotein CzcO
MTTKTFKTVIIGAGMSGISTAINLLDNNYKDFAIYEAQDRIGGRIDTRIYGNISTFIQQQHLFMI